MPFRITSGALSRSFWVSMVVVLVLTSSGRAQDRVNPLESATGLRCRFELGVAAVWQAGHPTAAVTPQEIQLVVADLDLQSGTAEMRGPEGRRLVTAMLSGGSLYIMQIERGALNVTSVFATESSPSRYKAALTRQSFVYLTVPPFMDSPTVTQSYGDCALVVPGAK